MSDIQKLHKGIKLEIKDVFYLLVWAVLFYFTWLFMHGAERFLDLTPQSLGKYFKWKYVIIAHITAGGGALLTGLIQFWPKLRNYSWRLHRVIGFVYLLAILVSSICAVTLAFTTAYEVNWAYAFSVQVWALVWISSTAIAYGAIIRKKVALHKQWMIRSYIVTIAFLVSGLSLKLTFIKQLGSFEDVSPSLFWFGWSVPLYLYEVLLIRKAKQ